jgi:hypothetical protein
LGEWPAWDGDARQPDVEIVLGPVPSLGDNAQRFGPAIEILGESLRLEIPNVASYRLDGNDRFVIEPYMPIDATDIKVFLFGTMLTVLCYRRGLVPLHASAVEINGRALLLAGRSGIGKSTLAACLVARGYRLIGDDLVALDHSNGSARIWPSFARLKLWQDAADHLGWSTDGLPQARVELRKFFIPVPPGPMHPLPPAHLVILGRALLPGDVGKTHLKAIDTLTSVFDIVHRWKLAAALGAQGQIFLGLAALVNAAPVTRLSRMDDRATLSDLADQVLALAAQSAPPPLA